PLPAGSSPQATIDAVYQQFEQALTAACVDVVGTKVVRPTSSPWLAFPGVKEARRDKISALSTVQSRPSDASARQHLKVARREWRKVSCDAKRHCFTALCDQIAAPDSKLRWALFIRLQPSAFSPLTSIANRSTGDLPLDHATSMDNLCAAFVANGTPPPPANAAAHSLLQQQVASWACPSNPPIPPPPTGPPSLPSGQGEGPGPPKNNNKA